MDEFGAETAFGVSDKIATEDDVKFVVFIFESLKDGIRNGTITFSKGWYRGEEVIILGVPTREDDEGSWAMPFVGSEKIAAKLKHDPDEPIRPVKSFWLSTN